MARGNSTKAFKLPFKFPGLKKEDKPLTRQKAVYNLKMVFFIVDWDKSKIISDVFEEKHVCFRFISRGKGTANSEMLDLLGIGASDKAVIICVEQDVLVPVLFKEVRKKLGFHSPGAGIAFTIPLSGINTPLLNVLAERIDKKIKVSAEDEGENMTINKKEDKPIEINNDLIIAIINQGYIDDLMTTAREAGAMGGTVIHARGLAHEGPVKFLGVSVQEEKEIVMILTNRGKKLPIMEAVSLSFGITSKAEGFIFSLPVDSVMGLTLE